MLTDKITHLLTGGSSLEVGPKFFALFQQPISSYLSRHVAIVLAPDWLRPEKKSFLLSVLLSIADHVGRDKMLRKEYVFVN